VQDQPATAEIDDADRICQADEAAGVGRSQAENRSASTYGGWNLGGKHDGRSGPPDQAERGCKVAASTEIGPMGPVRQFVEGFNSNDVDLAQAACTDETTIIDDLPPHQWTGPLATTSWLRDMARLAKDYGMSKWSVTLGEPRHVIVSDGHAYVVVPADVRWLQDGTPAERACLVTMALRQNADGWRVSSFAWTWS
jgi:ketosteroid isomerase-like protein